MTDPATMPPAPPKVEGPGLFEDLIEIFASPAKVFARRAKTGSTAAFFTIAIALSAILYSGKNVIEPIVDAQMTKVMATAQKANPAMTAEQVQSAMAMQKKVAPIITMVGAPIAMLILALFIWIAGKSLGATVTYGSSLMIASFSYVPRLLGALAIDVQGLLMSDTSGLTNMSQLSLSPARFLDPATANAALIGLLMRFDLTVIWGTALIAVGLAAAGKISKGKAISGAVILWLLASLFAIWGAVRGG